MPLTLTFQSCCITWHHGSCMRPSDLRGLTCPSPNCRLMLTRCGGGTGPKGGLSQDGSPTHAIIDILDIRINDIHIKYMHRHCLNFHFSKIQGFQGESMWSCQTATPLRSVTSHTRPFRGVYPEYQASLDLSCLISLSSSAPAALSSAGVAIMAYWTPQRHRLIASTRWISVNRSGFYLLGNGHSHVIIQEGFIAS